MAINRVVTSTLDKRSKYDGNRDRLGRVRKTGYSSRYNNQQRRGVGSSYKYSQYNKKVDVRKRIFKPYGRNNLSLMNRRYYNRGHMYTSRNVSGAANNRRIISRYDDKVGRGVAGKRGGDSFNRKPIASSYRDNKDRNRRIPFKSTSSRGGSRRIFYDNRRNNNKTRNLHGKIGKLSAKNLDAELDAYMGANNVKTRLDNELDSYFKNNTVNQTKDTGNN